MTAFLIDLDKLKKIGYVNKNVENNILATVLRRVQDTMLEPIIGTSMYKRLLQGVKDSDLNSNEVILMNDYIAPYLTSAVDVRSINALTYEIRSKTAGKARDEHIEPVTIPENILFSDDLRGDVEVYRQKLIGYLKDNCELYPEYKNFVCSFENIAPDKGKTKVNIRFC
jgi:hypothetical protein